MFEAGKQAEYDAFWDELQNHGNAKGYAQAFAYYMWNDKTYNPKYPFKIEGCNQMFANNTSITDTKVPLDFRGNKGQIFYVFENATNLVTIRTIILDSQTQSFSRWFNNCTSLQNITFEGVIGKSIDFSYSPLSVDSMINVISHLADYSDKNSENYKKYTVKFSDSCWEALENSGRSTIEVVPYEMTWKEACDYRGWNT